MTALAIVDNDFIEKSAAVLILSDLPELLGVPADGLRILPTAKWRYTEKRRKKVVTRLGEDAVNTILAFCDRTASVPEADSADMEALASIQNVDEGELMLASYASRQPDSLFATSDKRCIIALATAPSAVDLAARLSGRVVCFEQVVSRAVAKFGFEDVRARVVPNMVCDLALRSAFGSGLLATWPNVESTLDGHVANLRGLSGALLVHR